MKKIISVLLALVLMVSLCCFQAGAAKVEIAKTGVYDYFYTTEPYGVAYPANGWVIGYIGDTDLDGDITVLDATMIQKYAAEIIELSEDSFDLADADFDWEVSVLDAAEIQRHLASISTNEYITHTLYIDDTMYITHDEIADFVMAYGEHYDDYADPDYNCFWYEYYDEETDATLEIQYYYNLNNIDFIISGYDYDTGLSYNTRLETYRGQAEFNYYSSALSIYDDSTFYSVSGVAELMDMEDGYVYNVYNEEFYSEYNLDYYDIEPFLTSTFTLAIDTAETCLWDYTRFSVTHIFW